MGRTLAEVAPPGPEITQAKCASRFTADGHFLILQRFEQGRNSTLSGWPHFTHSPAAYVRKLVSLD